MPIGPQNWEAAKGGYNCFKTVRNATFRFSTGMRTPGDRCAARWIPKSRADWPSSTFGANLIAKVRGRPGGDHAGLNPRFGIGTHRRQSDAVWSDTPARIQMLDFCDVKYLCLLPTIFFYRPARGPWRKACARTAAFRASPKRSEGPYDPFGAAHSSTSNSAGPRLAGRPRAAYGDVTWGGDRR